MTGRWLLVLVLAALGQCASVEQIWKDAVQAHQQGQFEVALARYEEILKQQPDFVPALTNAGAVYSKLGRYEEAATQYRRALEKGGEHPGIRLNLALAYYNQARLGDAIEELEKLASLTSQARLLLADCYLRTGENKKVIALLDAPELADDRAVSYLLGTALIRDSQVERGQRIVNRVFQEGSAEGLMMLGAAQFAVQENKKAVATLEQALAKNSKLPGLYSLYGRARLTDGDPGAGKEAFLKELENNPTDFDANLHLGSLYRLDKEYDKARMYLDKARSIRPKALEVQYQIASLELGLGNVAEATRLLEELTAASPKFVEGHITLATAYYRQKRKSDGDRERAIVDKLNSETQSKELRTQ